MRTRVKICCISSPEEAELAIAAGADALGLVGRMPGGPGVIDDERIASIVQRTPPPVATFLLTSETDGDAIVAHLLRTGASTVQLVDTPKPGAWAHIRAALPHIRIVQVLHVLGPETLDEAQAAAPHVDALLLDSGNPRLAVKELGGTGRVHDWTVSRAIVHSAGRPVFLAGGLTPENVARAIAEVRPFGLDLCSGVRVGGRLDAARLAAFMSAVANA
jgi:phosphoribosylanthranilate isomerase